MTDKKRRMRVKKKQEQQQRGFRDRMQCTVEEREYTPEMTRQRPSYSNRSYVENLLDMAQDQGEFI